MKRLAFVLTAAVLGTGCIVATDDTGSVNLYWDFIRNAPAQPDGIIVYDESDVGSPDGRCDESGVDFVTVDSPAGQVSVPCVFAGVEGVGLDGIVEGTRTFRVRGWRTIGLSDVVVYDRTFGLAVVGSATTNHFLDVSAVSAPLDLFAFLAFGPPPGTGYPSCAAATPAGSASPPNLRFEVRDFFGTLVDQGTAACAGALPAAVFAGDLDLDDYKVRMQGLRVEDAALVFDSCSVDLAHFAAQTGASGLAPTLFTNPVPTCL